MPVDVSSFLLSVWGLSIPEGVSPTTGFVYVKEFELIAKIFETFPSMTTVLYTLRSN